MIPRRMAAILCLLLTCVAFTPFLANGAAAADGDITYVWDGEGADALASTAANWYKNDGTITDDIAPTSGSALVVCGVAIVKPGVLNIFGNPLAFAVAVFLVILTALFLLNGGSH